MDRPAHSVDKEHVLNPGTGVPHAEGGGGVRKGRGLCGGVREDGEIPVDWALVEPCGPGERPGGLSGRRRRGGRGGGCSAALGTSCRPGFKTIPSQPLRKSPQMQGRVTSF